MTQTKDGKPSEDYACVSAVIDAYRQNAAATARFAFTDHEGERWAPIIPDVSLTLPIEARSSTDAATGEVLKSYVAPGAFPEYKMDLPTENFLDNYYDEITERFRGLLTSARNGSLLERLVIAFGAHLTDDRAAGGLTKAILKDLRERKLVRRAGR